MPIFQQVIHIQACSNYRIRFARDTPILHIFRLGSLVMHQSFQQVICIQVCSYYWIRLAHDTPIFQQVISHSSSLIHFPYRNHPSQTKTTHFYTKPLIYQLVDQPLTGQLPIAFVLDPFKLHIAVQN